MTSHQDIILKASSLTFRYPAQPLFDNWSFDIPSGVNLVRGGDGRGKTSLLQLLAGVLPAQAGQLWIGDIALHEQPELYRQQVFWVDPGTDAFDQMTVHKYFASLQAVHPGFDKALLETLNNGLSLTPHLDKKLYMLSTGSKRKVWLSAAFAVGATLTLLDDPFAGLDQTSIRFVIKMLNEVAINAMQSWVIALYTSLDGVALSSTIDLGD